MAKKNRSSEPEVDEDDGGFRISKTRVGKQKMVIVTMQLTELQDAHLAMVAADNETTRAEFVKQATNYALIKMGKPFPDAGEVDEELEEALKARREKRKARALARASD